MRVLGKQNLVFPLGPVIKCLFSTCKTSCSPAENTNDTLLFEILARVVGFFFSSYIASLHLENECSLANCEDKIILVPQPGRVDTVSRMFRVKKN